MPPTTVTLKPRLKSNKDTVNEKYRRNGALVPRKIRVLQYVAAGPRIWKLIIFLARRTSVHEPRFAHRTALNLPRVLLFVFEQSQINVNCDWNNVANVT